MMPGDDPTAGAPPSASTDVLLALARLEGKVDVALTQHAVKIEAHGEGLSDHEERLRALEQRPTVSPRALWTTVSGALVLLVTLSPILVRLLGGTSS